MSLLPKLPKQPRGREPKTLTEKFAETIQRSSYKASEQQFKAYREALVNASTTTGNSIYWPLEEKEDKVPFDKRTEECMILILAGLARKAGGQLVMTESELGELSDQIHLDVNEKAGLVTVTVIPDYVKIGREAPDGFIVPDGSGGKHTLTFDVNGPLNVGQGDAVTFTFDPSGTYTVK